MRVPNATQFERPWRIHEVLGEFPLEDVWRLPDVTGTLTEFDELVDLMMLSDPSHDAPAAVRLLWKIRDLLGRWFGLGEIAHASEEAPVDSLRRQLPDDLRNTVDDVRFRALPFVPLYKTGTEFAAEVANATMHGVMHLAWVEREDGVYTPQMAVYVRPNGLFGRAYMQFIKPFRYAIVYPAMERHLTRQWRIRR